jgi:hypothetical protein
MGRWWRLGWFRCLLAFVLWGGVMAQNDGCSMRAQLTTAGHPGYTGQTADVVVGGGIWGNWQSYQTCNGRGYATGGSSQIEGQQGDGVDQGGRTRSGGSGGSLEPPGPLLITHLLTHLHTVHMTYSECLPTRLNPPG